MEDTLNKKDNVSGGNGDDIIQTTNDTQVIVNANNDSLLTDETAIPDLDVRWTRWKCLKCGFVYEGSKPLKTCPRCGNNDPDQFEDID